MWAGQILYAIVSVSPAWVIGYMFALLFMCLTHGFILILHQQYINLPIEFFLPLAQIINVAGMWQISS